MNTKSLFQHVYDRRKSELHDAKKKMDTIPDEQKKSILEEINQTMIIRKRLQKLFNINSNVCKECKTKCCDEFNPSSGDFIYYAAVGFELPSPTKRHQRFLDDMDVGSCYFLSENGCILDENKPVRCLTAVCENFPKYISNKVNSEIQNLSEKLKDKDEYLSNLCRKPEERVFYQRVVMNGKIYKVPIDSTKMKL